MRSRLLLVDLLGCLQWFNPAMWLLRREARVREEYTCDREANLGCTMEERRAYAHAMASLAAPRRREAFGTANMACGAAALRCRVEALFREEAPSPPQKAGGRVGRRGVCAAGAARR